MLALGLGIMIYAVINVSLVFTKQIKPFKYFDSTAEAPIKKSSLDSQDLLNGFQSGKLGDLTNLQDLISLPKLDSFLPTGQINSMLNLSSHFFLMFFVSGFGFKLASLGIQLIRPINVKLKSSFLDVDSRGNTHAVTGNSPQSLSPLPPKVTKPNG